MPHDTKFCPKCGQPTGDAPPDPPKEDKDEKEEEEEEDDEDDKEEKDGAKDEARGSVGPDGKEPKDGAEARPRRGSGRIDLALLKQGTPADDEEEDDEDDEEEKKREEEKKEAERKNEELKKAEAEKQEAEKKDDEKKEGEGGEEDPPPRPKREGGKTVTFAEEVEKSSSEEEESSSETTSSEEESSDEDECPDKRLGDCRTVMSKIWHRLSKSGGNNMSRPFLMKLEELVPYSESMLMLYEEELNRHGVLVALDATDGKAEEYLQKEKESQAAALDKKEDRPAPKKRRDPVKPAVPSVRKKHMMLL
mmetsp:Transcript_61793/g.116935  ORF Transcript_61793/g.116935 Transcript_61793/m.116935 type:complete len:307 (+) Transcript_61793:2-922(+)